MRSEEDAGRLDAFAREIDARVGLVAAAPGTVRLREGVLEKGQDLVARHEVSHPGARGTARPAPTRPQPAINRIDLSWPRYLPDGGRHGFNPPPPPPHPPPEITRIALSGPRSLPDGARHGFPPAHRIRLESALPAMAARL